MHKSTNSGIRQSFLQKFSTIPPSELVVLRGFPVNISEQNIFTEISKQTLLSIHFVRILRHCDPPISQVKFYSINDACFFIDLVHKGKITLFGSLFMADFGIEKKSDDWNCINCAFNNFAWRQKCYNCSKERYEPIKLASDDKPFVTVNNLIDNDLLHPDTSLVPTNFALVTNLRIEKSHCENSPFFSVDDVHKFIWDELIKCISNVHELKLPLKSWLVWYEDIIEEEYCTEDYIKKMSNVFLFIEFEDCQSSLITIQYFEKVLSETETKLPFITNTTQFTFGRDLYLLNALYLKKQENSLNCHLRYWDPNAKVNLWPKQRNEPHKLFISEDFEEKFRPTREKRIVNASFISSKPSKRIKASISKWSQRNEDFVQTTHNSFNNVWADFTLLSCKLCHIEFDSLEQLKDHLESSTEHATRLSLF